MSSNQNRTALIGKKLGMSQVWDENGFFVPVTLVDVATNVVTAVKSEDTDGYKAVQLGYGAIDPTKVTKPLAGHFAKAGVTPRRHLVEVRTDDADSYEPGQELAADTFKDCDRVDVTGRIHLPVDVRHVDVLEDAGHLTDGISLTDVGEERVAHALTLRRPPDDARDVHETHGGGHDALRVEDPRQHRQPGIRHPHHTDVRFDRRERVVGRQHVVAGQRVEQGRLAGVREADDSNGESHERRVYGTPPLEGAASCRQKYLRTSCVSQIPWVRVSSVNDTVGHRCSGPPLRAMPQALGRPAAPAFFSPWAGFAGGPAHCFQGFRRVVSTRPAR